MLSSVRNIFRVPDLRGKILFTLFILALYRMGAYVPAPGIDLDAVEELKRQAESGGGVVGFLQLFSGGALTQFAIFALGIMPYITASIIMQILTVVIPKLEEWQQMGAVGQRKITQWTRYLAVAIALLQSTGLAFLFHNGGGGLLGGGGNTTGLDVLPDFSPFSVIIVVLTLTAGTALLMWMGELISQRGIGNGMSLLIFASVVSSFPGAGARLNAEKGTPFLIALLALADPAARGHRVHRAGPAAHPGAVRQAGGRPAHVRRPEHLHPAQGEPERRDPDHLRQLGALPADPAHQRAPARRAGATPCAPGSTTTSCSPTRSPTCVVYGLLIIGFAYFYTAIAFDPAQQAENIRKQGGFIPGIRPGPQTERYLARILSRITLPGALFIAFIALLPSMLLAFADVQNFPFAGTSILIAVGVALETMKQIDSQLMMRNYEGFLK